MLTSIYEVINVAYPRILFLHFRLHFGKVPVNFSTNLHFSVSFWFDKCSSHGCRKVLSLNYARPPASLFPWSDFSNGSTFQLFDV